MSTAREIYEGELWRLPVRERRQALAKAVALADAEGDLDLGFEIRMDLISESHGSPDRLAQVAAYGWCLARHDEDPDRFPVDLWYYKWIPGAIAGSPAVSRAQIHALLDDLAMRFDSGAKESPPVVKLRMRAAFDLGDEEEAAELFDLWMARRQEMGRSRLDDCRACDIAEEASSLRRFGRHDEAIEAGLPLTDGNQGCASEPHYALANVLESARAVGAWDRAAAWQRRGLDLIENDPDYHDALADHIRHVAIAGTRGIAADGTSTYQVVPDQIRAALSLAANALPTLDGDEEFDFVFYRGVRVALVAADAAAIESEQVSELHAAVDGKAESLAAAFDIRSGNSSTSDLLRRDDRELEAGIA